MPSWLSDKLCNVLRKDLALDVENIGPDDRLIEDLGMDSVAFAIALVAIEDHTGVQLSGQRLMECHTIGEVDALFRVALAGGPGVSADA
ncbi:acyl carrier protein [Nocardia sp. NBC_01730]|uniref:acyl carrier protein n=1 Tax=Nocardia sp. NBC_01730 TaxID=2975998 RepID=UPI002E1533BA|nr:acyl carrier protein [Nocardia sp. NBC_01730]